MKILTLDPVLYETPIVRDILLHSTLGFAVTLLDPVLLMHNFGIIIKYSARLLIQVPSKANQSNIHQQTVNYIFNTFIALLLLQPLLPSCAKIAESTGASITKLQVKAFFLVQDPTVEENLHSFSAVPVVPLISIP